MSIRPKPLPLSQVRPSDPRPRPPSLTKAQRTENREKNDSERIRLSGYRNIQKIKKNKPHRNQPYIFTKEDDELLAREGEHGKIYPGRPDLWATKVLRSCYKKNVNAAIDVFPVPGGTYQLDATYFSDPKTRVGEYDQDEQLLKDFQICAGNSTEKCEVRKDYNCGCRESHDGFRIPSYAKFDWEQCEYHPRKILRAMSKKQPEPADTSSKGWWSRLGGTRKRRSKKERKSRTRKGRKGSTTEKTSKVSHRRKHYHRKSAKSVKRRPYRKRR